MKNHQIIRDGEGAELYVIVPIDDYREAFGPFASEDDYGIPHSVMGRRYSEGKSWLWAWREEAGKTQAEVAKHMGISQSTYSGMENSAAKPRRATLEKAAFALGNVSKEILIDLYYGK